jgi:hypothetical protein
MKKTIYGTALLPILASRRSCIWLPKGGNLLEIRGLAGTSIDDAIHAGIQQGVSKHPDLKSSFALEVRGMKIVQI